MPDYEDPIAKELMELALRTPSKFSVMVITDTRTGDSITVDQSMDSSLRTKSSILFKFLNEFLHIYFFWKNKSYNGEFDGKHKIIINNVLIDFGEYEGEKAWRWITRYVKIILNLMDKEGVIKLKEIEERMKSIKFEGKYDKVNIDIGSEIHGESGTGSEIQ